MYGIKILGSGMYVPENIVDNEAMSKIVDTNDEWITTRTGIKQRHIANGEPTWYMGEMAAKQAIKNAGIDANDVGLIIHTSITADFHTPSLACIIQAQLGIEDAMAMDVNVACSGFVYAVDMAKRYLQTDESLKYALVVSSETLSNITDYTDRSTCVLFGDGAGAVVIEKSDALFSSYLGADGSGAKFLFAKIPNSPNPLNDNSFVFDSPIPDGKEHYIHQDGKDVYKFATKILPKAALCACEKINLDVNEIDVFIPHQANFRIIETAAKNLGVPVEKFFTNLDKYGNTSSASIPIALYEAIEQGAVKRGDKVCLVGFGAGLSYAAIILEY